MKRVFGGFSVLLLMGFSLFGDLSQDPWKGKEYAGNSESQKSSAEEFLQSLDLHAVSSLLDVGCGDGKITAILSQIAPGARVLGVDISPSMIEFANQLFSNYPNLKFLVRDAAQMGFYEKFDLITSFTVMQWVVKQEQALDCFYKALKPNGRLCIQMPTGLPSSMEEALQKLISSEKWQKYFEGFSPPWRFFGAKEYEELLVDAGFSPLEIKLSTKHEKFPSREVFQEFLKQWFPYLRALPLEEKDVFLTELVDSYLEILPLSEEGRVSFIVTRLEVEALKSP